MCICTRVLRKIISYAVLFSRKDYFHCKKVIHKNAVPWPFSSPSQKLLSPKLSKQDSAVETEISLCFGRGLVTPLTQAS